MPITLVGGGPPTSGALLGSVDNIVTAPTTLTETAAAAALGVRFTPARPINNGEDFGRFIFGGFDGRVIDEATEVAAFARKRWTTTNHGSGLRLRVNTNDFNSGSFGLLASKPLDGLLVQAADVYNTEVFVPQGSLRFSPVSAATTATNDGVIRQAFGLELWQARNDAQGASPWRDVGTATGTYVQGDTTITVPGGGLTQADVGRYLINSAGDCTNGSVTIPGASNYVRSYIKAVSADGKTATLTTPATALAGPPLDPTFSMINVQFRVVDTLAGSPLHIAINDYLEAPPGLHPNLGTWDYRGGFILDQNRGPRGIIQIDGTTVFGNSAAAEGMPIAFQTGQVFTTPPNTNFTGGLGSIGFNFSSQIGAGPGGTLTLAANSNTAFVDNFAFLGGILAVDTTWASYQTQVGVFDGAILGHHIAFDAIAPHLTFGAVLGDFTGLHVSDFPGGNDSRVLASGCHTTFGSTTVTTPSSFFDSANDVGKRISGVANLIDDCFAPDTLITAVASPTSATVSRGALLTTTTAAFTVWQSVIGNMVGVDVDRFVSGGLNTGIRNASTTVFSPKFQNVSAAQSIMPDASTIYITSTGPVTLPNENITTYQAQDGQTLEIVNIGAYPITFTNGQGIFLGSSATLIMQPLDSAQFSYRGHDLGIAGQLWNLERAPGSGIDNVLRLDGVFNEVTAFAGYYGTQSFGTGLSTLALQHARGTKASPAYVHSLDTLQVFAFQGYNDVDNAYQNAASILAYASEDYHTAGHYGGALAFAISPPGTAVPTAVLTLQNDFITASRLLDANVGVSASNGPLGLTYVATEYGATNVNQPAILDLRGGRGGVTTSTTNLLFDVVARIYFAGSTASPSQPKVGVGRIDCVAAENWTDTGSPNFNPVHTGSQFQFHTTPNGTTTNHGIFALGVDTTGINIAGGQLSSGSGILTAANLIQANVGVSATNGPFGLTYVGSESGGPGVNLPSTIDLRGGRGTVSAPEINLLFDVVARFMFAGSTRKVSQPKVGVASINAVASENWTDSGSPNFTPTATGTDLQFWTNPNGTTTNHGQLAMTLSNAGNLLLVPGTVTGATMTGGQLDPISALHLTSTYTQTVDQTSVAIGTPLFVEMNPTFNYANARSATSVWGPRGMVHIGGTSIYAADTAAAFYIPPMGWNDAHVVKNSAGSTRTMNFGWSNISSRNYLADGGTITLNQPDAAPGPAAYMDSTAYLTRSSGTMNGTTHAVQVHSFASAPFVLGGAHFTSRAAYWVGDVNTYLGADGTSTMNGIFDAIYGSSDHGAGTVVNNYGVKIERMTFGVNNIGVSNAAGTVEVPQNLTVTSSTVIDANATCYYLASIGNVTLPTPWIAVGISGQRLKLINLNATGGGIITLPSGVANNAIFAQNVVLGPGMAIELEFGGIVWGTRNPWLPTAAGSYTLPSGVVTAGFTVGGALGVLGTITGANTITSNAINGGIGYSTGAGGTVTQAATNGKATAVTLNRACGSITMNGATLNASATVSFTLTNSSIAATDMLVLNHSSVGTVGSYVLNAQCGAGSAVINVRNTNIANLSEAIVLRFAIVKSTNN